MILGNIIGKTSTTEFKFKVENEAKKYQYIKIPAQDSYVLAQIIEIEKHIDETIASCIILGYKEDSHLRPLRFPLNPGTNVEAADDNSINSALGLEKEQGAFLGTLEYTDLKVHLDLNKLLTKHISIIAKSGSGKSYTSACLIEEILDRNIPLVILDPHAEYSTLKKANFKQKEELKKLNLEPKTYSGNIQEYTPDISVNPDAQQLKLSLSNISPADLLNILPARLSNIQTGLLYSSLQNLDKINFDDLIISLDTEETNAKYTLINLIEQIKTLNIFSDVPTTFQELVQPGKASLVNLKGISPEISEIVVYKLVNDLFEARKLGNIPPFFLVIEEAQNFAPERAFGEAKSSQILRRVLAEGRKFGLGCCLITQRPSRIDKSVLSQCTTQIILKVTNPNDLRSLTSSVEGLTAETEKEIKNLPIGTALLVGVVPQPLFVNVRPRKSEHGGEAIDIVGSTPQQVEEAEETEDSDLLPVIKQKTSLKDLELASEKKIISKETILIPCLFVQLQQDSNQFNILINLNENKILTNLETLEGQQLPLKITLSENQLIILRLAIKLKKFTPAELFNLSKLQFSEVYDIIKNLSEKNLFLKHEENKFTLNKTLQIFSEIQGFSSYLKPEYLKTSYDRKLELLYNKDDVLKIFSNFFTITNSKECFLETFKLAYEEKED
ncbi:MAG: ATPase [Nanoarchaeota archaeon]|jgi:hypothetical protein|nr:ATPase [Nanoarchaeota archaeon]|tara:strand:- start:4449 stop:6458 length:2010 start_codon:yes stop_codon:yes gene_type:complete